MNAIEVKFKLESKERDARPVYLVGNFNNWNPADPAYKMAKVGEGKYEFTLTLFELKGHVLEYKYTKGDWSEVELSNKGGISANRQHTLLDKHVEISDTVTKWRRNWLPYSESKLPFLEVVDEAIHMLPFEDGRRRKVWAILPFDYHSSGKSYPVLYLQDAQNAVNGGSKFGNWDLEKKMAVLAEYGRADVIVIAIEHGAERRNDEYNYNSQRLGKKEGKKYLRFIVETLKPVVDQKYRTLKNRDNTGIGGSSLGGLISIFAGILYPDIFSKLMIFSPSIWAMPPLFFPALLYYKKFESKWYFYSGKIESANHYQNAEQFIHRFLKIARPYSMIQSKFSVHPEGTHSEPFWADEFPKAIEWLFYDTYEDPSKAIAEDSEMYNF